MRSVYASLKNLYSSTAIDSSALSTHTTVKLDIKANSKVGSALNRKTNSLFYNETPRSKLNQNSINKNDYSGCSSDSNPNVRTNGCNYKPNKKNCLPLSHNCIPVYLSKFIRNSDDMLNAQLNNTLTLAEKRGLVSLDGKLTRPYTVQQWEEAEKRFLNSSAGLDFICVLCFGYLGNCSKGGQAVITTCGHTMHLYCFSCYRENRNIINFSDNSYRSLTTQANPRNSQLSCPLCRKYCMVSYSEKIQAKAQEYCIKIIQSYTRGYFARRKANARRYFKSDIFQDSLRFNTNEATEKLKEQKCYIIQELQHTEKEMMETNDLVDQLFKMRNTDWQVVLSKAYSRCSVCPVCFAPLEINSKLTILPQDKQINAKFKILSCCSSIVHAECLKNAERDWFNKDKNGIPKMDDDSRVILCCMCKKCYSDLGIEGVTDEIEEPNCNEDK